MATERTDWFEIWCEDKQNILNTMARNMAADLEAGYDFFGNSIQRQIREMEPSMVNNYCYVKLKKAGAI